MKICHAALAAFGVMAALAASAATAIQIGPSGKTYASAAVACTIDPVGGQRTPTVEAGLFEPRRSATATVTLDGASVGTVTAARPAVTLPIPPGEHIVAVVLGRKVADRYAFTVVAGQCELPDTSGNTFSSDGTLEYAASGKSYATVVPGCAFNAATGRPQPYVHLFDNGTFLLDVSVNGRPLTQLSASHPHTPVFLEAGLNVIAAANASLSVDQYVRDGGTGGCALP